jgi:hypothetical protein
LGNGQAVLLSGDQVGKACLAKHAEDLQRIWYFLKQRAVTFRLHFTFPENVNHITSPVRGYENFNEIESTVLYLSVHKVPTAWKSWVVIVRRVASVA